MPEYLSPGVYVEEIDAGPKPIAPVATSTAGAVGRHPARPGRPTLVTNYGDFVRIFGGPLDLPVPRRTRRLGRTRPTTGTPPSRSRPSSTKAARGCSSSASSGGAPRRRPRRSTAACSRPHQRHRRRPTPPSTLSACLRRQRRRLADARGRRGRLAARPVTVASVDYAATAPSRSAGRRASPPRRARPRADHGRRHRADVLTA